MRVLVVGSGGREHALCKKINESSKVKELFVAPGNYGIKKEASCVDISVEDISSLVSFAKEKEIDLTIVGPEAPLALGIVDEFEKEGLKIFGPSKEAAKLESSKVFAKQVMEENDIPTARASEFTDSDEAKKFAASLVPPVAIKADGLCAGKGVVIAQSREEILQTVVGFMEEKEFGDASAKILIEEYLEGQEVSVLAFCDGENIIPMVSSQDHKPAYDGDRGPNTGGMGAYSPAPIFSDEDMDFTTKNVLKPTVKAMGEKGVPFKGILYAGLIMTEQGPKVLEFNVRFGDPEAQAVIPRLKTDLVDVMIAACNGKLDSITLDWDDRPAVCVVAASGGYPGSYTKGYEIKGIDDFDDSSDVMLFGAGVKDKEGVPVTAGGRVLGVTAMADTLADAQQKAYRRLGQIDFKDMHYRRDIGDKGVNL
ncbi:phosphoribosylamine--glycine ligase [Natranaerofaba carboxydovora]|uniref:phosphoribosylamine--glycine ligase n=1 Tax=Natranaerofaba carboxydovora TaxID=2742683 RepID=UPI001F136BE9|nr:phosphoribosylamine--glycine ligase [Natranaerofaba carboxydovora]